MLLIDDIIMLPTQLFLDTLEKIKEMADEERLTTLDSIKRKFLEVQTDYEEGGISESEYQEATEFLSDRLEAIMNRGGKRKR